MPALEQGAGLVPRVKWGAAGAAGLGAELAAPLNDPERPFEHICYTVPWNMAENPAVSINGGYDAAGFPIGVQIIGRRFDDLGVLAVASAFEAMRARAARPWPEPPARACG